MNVTFQEATFLPAWTLAEGCRRRRDAWDWSVLAVAALEWAAFAVAALAFAAAGAAMWFGWR